MAYSSITTSLKNSVTLFLIVLVALCVLYSCKKDAPIEKEQQVTATAVDAANKTVLFNASGSKVDLVHYYQSTAFSALNETNAMLYIQFDSVGINTPGTYPLVVSQCEYRIERIAGAMYFNSSQNDPGTVTITAFTNNYIEGSFYLVCLSSDTPKDSVTITGTFKGEY